MHREDFCRVISQAALNLPPDEFGATIIFAVPSIEGGQELIAEVATTLLRSVMLNGPALPGPLVIDDKQVVVAEFSRLAQDEAYFRLFIEAATELDSEAVALVSSNPDHCNIRITGLDIDKIRKNTLQTIGWLKPYFGVKWYYSAMAKVTQPSMSVTKAMEWLVDSVFALVKPDPDNERAVKIFSILMETSLEEARTWLREN
jgi:hypothetical protein